MTERPGYGTPCSAPGRSAIATALAALGLLLAIGHGVASAAAPSIDAVWASTVDTAFARLHADVDPQGLAGSYHFDYIAKAAYEANLSNARDPFTGAARLPAGPDANLGAVPTTIGPLLTGLSPGTAYRYRLVVRNADGTTTSPTFDFATHSTSSFALPDNRGWELVSPVEKNGGGVADPAEAGGGTSRAASQGGGVTFVSRASFAGATGAAPFSQYLSTRNASGWSTQNITPAHLTGAYEGAPYAAFSADLARSLYLNPARCPDGDPCLPGYRLRESSSGTLTPSPADPGSLLAASEDLSRFVLAEAGELYLWSPPAGSLVDLNATPSVATLPPFGAVSVNAGRIYYLGTDDNLHLREGAVSRQIDVGAGGGGSFEAATPDGSQALYTKAGHLHRYRASTGASEDLVPAGGVVAGSARISPDATKVLFASTTPLTTSDGETYDNIGLNSEAPESQVYLHDATADSLTCVSCNPTHGRPIGPSSVPGAPGPHQSRVLSADGRGVFFDSRDALVLSDVNLAPDVYQWRAQGSGGCARPNGCVALISAGLAGRSTFIDASADGADAFFLTDRSLVGADPGSVDLYDARIGGGFPAPVEPSPCVGDACQTVPPAVEDPVLTTVLAGPGNSRERYWSSGAKAKKRCPRGKRLKTVKRKRGKAVKKCVKARAKKRVRGGRR